MLPVRSTSRDVFMNNQEWKLQIDNLVTLIEEEEENYKLALKTQTDYLILQKMKERVEDLPVNSLIQGKKYIQKAILSLYSTGINFAFFFSH